MNDTELLNALFRTATDAILVTDRASGRVLDANPAACRLYRYDREQLRSLTLAQLTADAEELEACERGEDTGVFLRHHRRATGEIVPVEVTATYLVTGGESVRVALARDVTEILQTEEDLRASETRFEVAFRTSPDSVNINRVSDGLFLDINDGFTALTGYTEEDTQGKTSLEIELWADPEDRARLVRMLQDQGYANNLEARFRMKDGSVRTGLMSARLITWGGQPCILSVTRDITERKVAEDNLAATNLRLEEMVFAIAEALGRTVEMRDPYTAGHERRVEHVSTSIGQSLGLTDGAADCLAIAALVHDVGKLSVPSEILSKPGRLSSVEFELIKMHPERGYEILSGIDLPWGVADVVLQHHERMDGSGYPNGLAGDDISELARILAVADVIEAMASHRPYRPALGIEAAMQELTDNAPKYDEDVVEACRRLHAEGLLAPLLD